MSFTAIEIKEITSLLDYAIFSESIVRADTFRAITGFDVNEAKLIWDGWSETGVDTEDDLSLLLNAVSGLISFPHNSWGKIYKDTGISQDHARNIRAKARSCIKTQR